ncbi:formate/nitrite transporter family protein [Peptostreptococcus equinus]|uniref:Formate/nitrite transporter family protein n=1 Tax=Peptostreptococcus equinus TaxID=3003601 RepID=A0ABY7JU04_9FIRM|nr:formate/nitrite transporter family protein [Peptostreptococcus sp. CBA3647]WAW15392.1 formate/nitrite transporter family protein [Peptostreptococcus sp. CBA3647]
MYDITIEKMTNAAKKKAEVLKSSILKYLISSAFAGAFIGIGILLIFTIGSQLGKSPATKTVMGLAFGIALNLVIFTGTDLFTGNNMVMTVGTMNKGTKLSDLIKVWCTSYIGNLIGAIILSFIFVGAGFMAKGPLAEFFSNAAQAKASGTFIQLFYKGILCNMLVCLAVLITFRTENDVAKLFMTVFCLFAFITSGFEHSIANMTVYAVPLLSGTMSKVTMAMAIHNLVPVTLGNVVGGAIIMGLGSYSLKSKN